jgi:hypothetical protein
MKTVSTRPNEHRTSPAIFGWLLIAATFFSGCGGDDAASASSSGQTCNGDACGGNGSGAASTGGCGECPSGSGSGAAGATSVGGSGSGGSGSGAGGMQGTSCAETPEPARYPLELASPRAAGSLPSSDPGTPAMPSGHRIFRAYPGLEYNIRAVVIGGSYPFAYALSDAPDGMTIDPGTGEIQWPNPSGSTATPTISVTDCEGTQVSSSWTITVGTDSFRFMDATNGSDDNAGTLESPWQTIAKLQDSGMPGEIVYFRGGTYSTSGTEVDGGGGTWARVDMNGSYNPVQWIAYPGETPVIDNAYGDGGGTGQFVRFSGSETHPVYVDGFEIVGSWDKAMQFGSGSCDYPVFRRLDIHDIAEAIDGSNSAGIMSLSNYADPSWYSAFQDNDFHDNGPGGIKQYSQKKFLWEDCKFRDSGDGPDLKSHVIRFDVRRCEFYGNSGARRGLFGNMNEGEAGNERASGEVRYNRMLGIDDPYVYVMDVNQDSMAGLIHLYRNTWVGTVRVWHGDSDDGPFHFTRNVIVNSNEGTDHITLEDVSDPSVVTYTDNLAGTPAEGIVDADGNLQGSFTSFIGSRGHFIP